jgi:hypothetical protein
LLYGLNGLLPMLLLVLDVSFVLLAQVIINEIGRREEGRRGEGERGEGNVLAAYPV